jgi:hypothetical protein
MGAKQGATVSVWVWVVSELWRRSGGAGVKLALPEQTGCLLRAVGSDQDIAQAGSRPATGMVDHWHGNCH